MRTLKIHAIGTALLLSLIAMGYGLILALSSITEYGWKLIVNGIVFLALGYIALRFIQVSGAIIYEAAQVGKGINGQPLPHEVDDEELKG